MPTPEMWSSDEPERLAHRFGPNSRELFQRRDRLRAEQVASVEKRHRVSAFALISSTSTADCFCVSSFQPTILGNARPGSLLIGAIYSSKTTSGAEAGHPATINSFFAQRKWLTSCHCCDSPPVDGCLVNQRFETVWAKWPVYIRAPQVAFHETAKGSSPQLLLRLAIASERRNRDESPRVTGGAGFIGSAVIVII